MLTVVYDGQCVLCSGTKRFVSALDWRKRVRWIDLHDRAQVAKAYPGLDYAEAMGQIHLRDRRGKEYAGFFATRRMLKELPLTYPLWLLMHLPGMTWLGQRIYRLTAGNRYKLNRLFGVATCEDDACRVN